MLNIRSNIKHNSGFTLAEILVSLAISSVLLAGFIKVFAGNQLSSRMISSFGIQQDNARVAHYVLSKELRQAGHFGGVEPEEVSVHSDLEITGVGSCDEAWITETTEPVRGYDGADDIADVNNFPESCISNDVYIKSSDLLVVRYASAEEVSTIDGVSDDQVYVRTIIGGNGLSGAEIFKGSDGSNIGGSSDPVGTYNYKYVTDLYYLKACSIESDDNGCVNDTPSLVRYQLDGTTFTEHVLVEGVEQFQIEFGIDSNSDFTADVYKSPDDVTNWKQVISIRFDLVIRGGAKDPHIKDNSTYSLVGGVNYTPSDDDKRYRRQVYTKVVQLRNMSRG